MSSSQHPVHNNKLNGRAVKTRGNKKKRYVWYSSVCARRNGLLSQCINLLYSVIVQVWLNKWAFAFIRMKRCNQSCVFVVALVLYTLWSKRAEIKLQRHSEWGHSESRGDGSQWSKLPSWFLSLSRSESLRPSCLRCEMAAFRRHRMWLRILLFFRFLFISPKTASALTKPTHFYIFF